MRVPLSWLRTFVDWQDDVAELASALTARGLSVETVDWPGRGCAGIVAARINAISPHPTRSNLSVVELSDGHNLANVVTSATGIAPGDTVPWARPGGILPGWRTVKVRSFDGVPSAGLLCSCLDLGCALEESETLLPLDQPVGTDLVRALFLDDPVLEIELTPNYATHCQSILGVAREVAALTGGRLRMPDRMTTGECALDSFRLNVACPELCSRYVARLVRWEREPAPTPLWMVRHLCQCGIRSLSPIVDITNYVMLELGQPLHAFDRAHLHGDTVCVRRALPGEHLTTLDGREHFLQATDLVIADGMDPIALAGVMGGTGTSITEATLDVVLESAVFSADAVGHTARAHGLHSEAAQRFSRGVDPAGVTAASDRAIALLRMVGGTVYGERTFGPAEPPPRSVSLRGARLRQWMGVRLSTSAAGRLLSALGFEIQADGADRLRVNVPSWRSDVHDEVDLIEEVCRMYGYERIPATLPEGAPTTVARPPLERTADAARKVALGAGFTEVIPYTYHSRELWDRLRIPPEHPWHQAVAIANPMRVDQEVLRTTTAASLLRVLETNARYRRLDVACFEVGPVFASGTHGIAEIAVLGLAGMGCIAPQTWQGPGTPCDFFRLKGTICALAARLGIAGDRLIWSVPAAGELPTLHPGRAALLALDGVTIGWAGQCHPNVQEAFGLPDPAVLAEIQLEPLWAVDRSIVFQPIPRYPAVRRDIALLVPVERSAAEVQSALHQAATSLPDLRTEVRLFDLYQGKGVPAGWRSLAFTLWFQAERTLRDEEVDQAMALVVRAVTDAVGASLRGADLSAWQPPH